MFRQEQNICIDPSVTRMAACQGLDTFIFYFFLLKLFENFNLVIRVVHLRLT